MLSALRRFNAEASVLEAEALLRGEVTSADIPPAQLTAGAMIPSAPNSSARAPGHWQQLQLLYLFNFMPTYEEKTVDGFTLNHEQWFKAANNINFRKSIYYGGQAEGISTYNQYTPNT